MVKIQEINNRDEFNSFVESDKESLHIVKFGADWCGPCKLLETRLKNLDDEKVKGVCFAEVTIADEPTEELASEFEITNIPVMLFIKNGEVKQVTRGALGTNEIYEKINNLLS